MGSGLFKGLELEVSTKMNYTQDDLRHLRDAYKVAAKLSIDPSTQNGAIIVGPGNLRTYVSAANCFPEGVANASERWERPTKYTYVEHAERNAIFLAAKWGQPTLGATMYCPWAACVECARAIIQAGIGRLVTHKYMTDATPDHWKESIALAMDMLKEADVRHDEIDAPIDGVSIRFNGKIWYPDGRGYGERQS